MRTMELSRPWLFVEVSRFLLCILFSFVLIACTSNEGSHSEEGETGSQKVEGSVQSGEVDTAHRVVHTIYVPVYSHIYSRDRKRSIDLAVTLSVRNTDASEKITITAVRYYDSDGKVVKDFQEKPYALSPMASAEFLVEEDDATGGSGANFIVELATSESVTQPVVEAVMIGTSSAQGISFTSSGREIRKEFGGSMKAEGE